jgi:hypothetical protein
MARSKFAKDCLKWCQENRDDLLSKYFLDSFKETGVHKEEARRWKQIADALGELSISYNESVYQIKSRG